MKTLGRAAAPAWGGPKLLIGKHSCQAQAGSEYTMAWGHPPQPFRRRVFFVARFRPGPARANRGEGCMGSANIDLPAILNRALEYAAQTSGSKKLLIQLGLDPSNVTYDAVFNRLVDVALANINFANMLALVGAGFYVATLMVRTIVPLRVIGIISIVFFIGYGALAGAMATFFLYLLSLPIQRHPSAPDAGARQEGAGLGAGRPVDGWLRPFMSPRKYKKGDVLFAKAMLPKRCS